MSSFSVAKFAGKVAMVTGASSGIGQSIAETLVKYGVIVAGLARRKKRLEEIANSLSTENGKFYPFKCDLGNQDDIQGVFQEIKKLGPIYILINNAAVHFKTEIIDGDIQMWRSILDTNILAVTIFSREVIRNMKENKIKDHIVNINGVFGHKILDLPGVSLYPASKYALRAQMEILRLEINRSKLPIKITASRIRQRKFINLDQLFSKL